MKFTVGDVVRYTDPGSLVKEFYDQWGLGPFVVDSRMGGAVKLLHCSTPEGVPVTQPDGNLWGFGTSNLVIDPFLTAARKAIHETKV